MTASFNTEKTENSTTTWITPPEVLEPLGKFDLDPCAADVQPWACAEKSYTKEQDGLKQEWHGRVWCNPPYGKEAEAFMRRMAEHKNGLALVFCRTDTKWFHEAVLNKALYMFLYKGRIKFRRPDGTAGASANAASCLIAWNREELPTLKRLETHGVGKIVYLHNEQD